MAFHFEGFSAPNGTFVPDEVFDLLAPALSEAELRVLLYIIRRTFGFKKNTDDISLKQMTEGITTREGRVLDRGTGLSKAGNVRGIRGLIEKGVVVTKRNRSTERGDQATTYTLHFKTAVAVKGDRGEEKSQAARKPPGSLPQSSERYAQVSRSPVSTKETGGCLPSRQGGVYQVDTQETVWQETDFNLSNIRMQYAAKIQNPEMHRQEREPQSSPSPKAASFEAISAVLLRTRQPLPDAPPEEAAAAIRTYIAETSQMFNDQAPLNSSTSRAVNLYQKSKLPLGEFLSRLYETRSHVKERRDKVKSQVNGRKKTMAYFFACLEDRIGLRADSRPRHDSLRHAGEPLTPAEREDAHISPHRTSSPRGERGGKDSSPHTHSFAHHVPFAQSGQSSMDALSVSAAPSS
jgi:hypothetical protein